MASINFRVAVILFVFVLVCNTIILIKLCVIWEQCKQDQSIFLFGAIGRPKDLAF